MKGLHRSDQGIEPLELVQQKARRIRHLTLWLTVLIAGGISLVALQMTLNGPSEGQIQTQAVPTPIVSPTTEKLSLQYFTLEYPSRFSVATKPTDKPPSGLLDYRILTAQTRSHAAAGQIAISVKPLPEGGITNDSSYRYFASNTTNYKTTTHTYGDETVTICTLTTEADSTEIVAFWPHDNYLATIALHEFIQNPEESSSNLDQILQTLDWL